MFQVARQRVLLRSGFARVGGNANNGLICGGFACTVNNTAANANWNYGVALSICREVGRTTFPNGSYQLPFALLEREEIMRTRYLPSWGKLAQRVMLVMEQKLSRKLDRATKGNGKTLEQTT